MSINTLSANPIIAQEALGVKFSSNLLLTGGSVNQITPLDGNNVLGAQVINGIKANKSFMINVSLFLPSGCTAGATATTCAITVNGQAYATLTGSAVVGAFQNTTFSIMAHSLIDNPSINIVLGSTGAYFNCGVANCFTCVQMIQ